MKPFVLDRFQHARGAMPTTAVVEDLQVLEHGGGQLHSGPPSPSIEKFDLHATPEGFDHRIVVGIAHRPYRWERPRALRSVSEDSGSELSVMISVDDGLASDRPSVLQRHAESVGRQRCGRRGVDGPADHLAGEQVQDDAAVELPFGRLDASSRRNADIWRL